VLSTMAIYFFDFRSGDVIAIDENGLDTEAARRDVLEALADEVGLQVGG
jgi:hypothetical protein